MMKLSLGLWATSPIKQHNRSMFFSRSRQNDHSSNIKKGLESKVSPFFWPLKIARIQPKQLSQAEKSFLEKHWNQKSILSPRKPSSRTISETVYRVEDSSLGVVSTILSFLGYIPIFGCVAAGISMLTHGHYSYLRSENTKLDQAIKKTDTLHFLSSLPVFITKTVQISSSIELASIVCFSLFSILGAIKSTLELIKNGRIIFNCSKIKKDLQNSQIHQKNKDYLIKKLSKKQRIEGFKGVGNSCLLVGSVLMLIPFCQIPGLVFLIIGSFIRCGIALNQYRKLGVKNKKIPFIKEELTLRHRINIRSNQKATTISDAIAVTQSRLDRLTQESALSRRLTQRLAELYNLQKEDVKEVWGWHSDANLKDGYTSQFDFYIKKNSKGEDELVSLQSSINPYQTQGKPVQTELRIIEDSINDQLYHFLSTSKVIKKLKEDYQNDTALVCLLDKADSLLS